jgi:hypothetical protein
MFPSSLLWIPSNSCCELLISLKVALRALLVDGVAAVAVEHSAANKHTKHPNSLSFIGSFLDVVYRSPGL